MMDTSPTAPSPSEENEEETIFDEFPFILPPPKHNSKGQQSPASTPFAASETKDYFEEEQKLDDWGEHFPTVDNTNEIEPKNFDDIDISETSDLEDDFLDLLQVAQPNEDFHNVENAVMVSEITEEETDFQTFSEETFILPGTDNLPQEETSTNAEEYFFEENLVSFYENDLPNENTDSLSLETEIIEEPSEQIQTSNDEERRRKRKRKRRPLPKKGVIEEKIALALGILTILIGWAILPIISSGITIGLALYSKKKAATGQDRPLTYANIAIGLGIASLVFSAILFTILSKNTV